MAGDPPRGRRKGYFSWLRLFVRRGPRHRATKLDVGFLFDDGEEDGNGAELEAKAEDKPEQMPPPTEGADSPEPPSRPPDGKDQDDILDIVPSEEDGSRAVLRSTGALTPLPMRILSALSPWRVRERLRPAWRWILGFLPLIGVAVWWVWATAGEEPEFRRVTPVTLPSPYEMAEEWPPLWHDAALMRNAVVSLKRVMGGFGIAMAIALPLGIAMASFCRIGAVFGVFCTVISYIPIAAIVPLTMAWWGTGEKQKMGFLALGTFAYLLPLVVRSINSVGHQYLLSAYAQGASAWQVVWRVLIPVSLPDIVNALRLCLGIGWTYIVLAEVVRDSEGLGGLGNLIMISWRRGHMDRVYLILVTIMVVGVLLDRVCALLSRLLFPYRSARTQE